MPNRRDLFKPTAFIALAALAAEKLPNGTLEPSNAQLIKEPFGDNRICTNPLAREYHRIVPCNRPFLLARQLSPYRP